MDRFKNIKLIMCDLDGTLLNFTGKVSESTREVINELHKKNYILVANSGRPLYSIPEEVYKLPFDYIVGMNGQIFLNVKNNVITEKQKLNKEDLVLLHKLGNKHISISNLHYEDKTYLIMNKKNFIFGFLFNQLNRMRFVFKQMKRSKVKYSININKLHLEDIAKICFISLNGNLKNLQKEIESLPNKPYDTFLVAKNWLEVMPANINKGVALEDIANIENIEIKDTLAIGDGENDIPMLKKAGIGVAMGNAMDNTKTNADYIAPSFLEDGFAIFFKENLLKK